jgi:probable O-glycosylation ligase (exosortase A-associated)
MEQLAFTGLRAGVDELRARPIVAPTSGPAERAAPETDRSAFYGLLAFTFVLFFRPQDSLPILQPLHLADLTAIFAVLSLVRERLSRGAAISSLSRELILVLALAAVMIVTAPFSIWPGGAITAFTDLFFKVIVVFTLMLNTVTTRERLSRFITIVVLGTSYIGVRAVLDYVRGVNLYEDGRVGGAVGGLFGNPNDMALNMVTFLPLAVSLALLRGRPLVRALAVVGVPAIAAAIIFSKSRGGTVGLVLMLVVLLFQMRRIRPGVAVAVLALSLATIPLLPPSFLLRMSSIYNPDEDPTGSREARRRLLREGYEAFLDNPIVGLGAGQFSNYQPDKRDEPWRETHNAVLQVASELGVIGLLLFVILVASGFAAVLRATTALRRSRHPPPNGSRARHELEVLGAALVAGLAGWFAAAMFASVAYYWTFYIVLGLAVTYREITLRDAKGIRDAGYLPEAEAA